MKALAPSLVIALLSVVLGVLLGEVLSTRDNATITYLKDRRTGLCFARWGDGGGVMVPCEKLPQTLVEVK